MTTPMPPSAGGQPARQPDNTMGTLALVMGILQFVCLGPIASVLAIVFGKIGMNKAERGEATNGDMAKWGFWLGIIGLILGVIAFIVWIIIIAVAASSGDLEITTN
jgi:hypothetical protein